MAIGAPSVPRGPGEVMAVPTPSAPSSALPAPVDRWLARVRPELDAPIRTIYLEGSTAEKVPWTATVSGWRDFGSLLYPSRVEARWADEAKPWLRMGIDRAAIDPPMSEPLARARAMLAALPS